MKRGREMGTQTSAAIYVRTSTADKQDPAGQESELRALVEKRGWRVFKVYLDHGYSGAKASRPAFDEMWADCRRGKISVVCVWALDRFGRSLKNLIEGLEELQRLGVHFLCLKQDLDSTSPAGRLLFHIVGAVAEFEHHLIRGRIAMGMDEARRKGKHIGRPPLRKFSEAEVEQIRAERKKERSSIRQLAIRFGTSQWMVKGIVGERQARS
jgi:DNA invertase Pin-like site-specific DNA recombinase